MTLFASTLATAAPASARSGDALAPRIIAEWEPALGALISYPFALPNDLVVEFAGHDHLFVLVDSPGDADAAAGHLGSLGVSAGQYTLIQSSVQTEWTRDWGPHQVFSAAGEWSIVDPIFEGYPWVGPTCGPISSPGGYNGDDAVNPQLAAFWNAPLVTLPAYLVGGNFLVDGFGRGFATCTQVSENLQIMTETQFRQILRDELGVDDLVILEPTENNGIQHIDCWMKVVDEETLLVKRAPDWHEEHARLEANVALLESLTTPWGRPYRIVRLDCPPYNSSEQIANYTNFLILNDRVYVPTFGIPADDAALSTIRDVMPGYEVIGFPYSNWYYYDALHCRTRAVFDADMVRLMHAPPRLGEPAAWADPVPIDFQLEDMSGTGVETAVVHWRITGADDAWQIAPASELAPGSWRATLPGLEPGVSIDYWIEAGNLAGRTATLPRVAPDHVYTRPIAPNGLAVDVVDVPAVVPPRAVTLLDVTIDDPGGELLVTSPELRVRVDQGPWARVPLLPVGGADWMALLPAAACGETLEWHIAVEGAISGERHSPPGAPVIWHTTFIGAYEPADLLAVDPSAGLPVGWSMTGDFRITADCGATGCDGTAAISLTGGSACSYSGQGRVTGLVRSAEIALPDLKDAASITLEYCSRRETEDTDGYDTCAVFVNGEPVDVPANDGVWRTRTVDLTRFAGQSVAIEWRFDSVDGFFNDFLGWQIDDIRLIADLLECDNPSGPLLLPRSPLDASPARPFTAP